MANTMTLISTVTVGSGGTSAINFTSIPSTYTDLCIKLSARTTTTSSSQDYIKIRFNSDTGNNYADGALFANTASVGSVYMATTDAIGGIYWTIVPSTTATANTFGNADIYIPNYRASTYKSIQVDATSSNNAGAQFIFEVAGMWLSTSAITSISLIGQDGTINQNSTASLYGIKNS